MTSTASFSPSFGLPSMHTASEQRAMKSHVARIRRHRTADDVESALGRRVAAFLVSRHPIKTAENVSADTGGRIPINTIKTWLGRESDPSGRAYARLWLTYGPEFLAATAKDAPPWLDAAYRAEQAAIAKADIAARQARLAELLK